MRDLFMGNVARLFHIDALAMIMMILVGFVAVSVGLFSRNYLKGDVKYRSFFITLGSLVMAVGLLVCADNIFLFLLAWAASNLLLVRLMIHKPNWRAARFSGIVALRNFIIGYLGLVGALAVLYAVTGETSIQKLVNLRYDRTMLSAVLVLLTIGAFTQSAIWPFHRWLTSSLNSPTPVSAIMHAGLVNGGGFLITRFSPLYFQMPHALVYLFVAGLFTAILGTLCKLMQSDVKRMLACSTMGQMGFMILQCGLGLFPAAIAHLCWHGLFKSYLFLTSGSAAQEKRLDLAYPPSPTSFILSLLCGIIGTYVFIQKSHKNLFAEDTTLLLIGIAYVAGAQLALTIVSHPTLKNLVMAVFINTLLGGMYGISVYSIETVLSPLNLLKPQPIEAIHIWAFAILFALWFSVVFRKMLIGSKNEPRLLLRLYVEMLNASQPHPKTITAHRNHYKYL
jgi:NAD(P)H-quinone oxidoreductase subunit 5